MASFVPPKQVGAPREDEPAECVDEILQMELALGTANAMSAMEVKDPELLRATLSSSALRCCGRALHQDFRGDLHHKSFRTDGLDCFWSHSWHGNSWQKILLLMVVYNGRAALIAGNLAAALGMTLFYLDLLPCYSQRYMSLEIDYGPWGFVFGCSATFCMLLAWQSGSKIFLDRICIHQVDEERKMEGIRSLGGLLRHSRSMLVLWDSTYPTRLWTVFELAAFLKSHDNESQLLIRPTILGPMAMAVFVYVALLFAGQLVVSFQDAVEYSLQQMSMFLFVCVAFMHLLRVYLEWVENCWLQLRSFSLAETTTYCCSSDHKDESGNSTACDREILLECVRMWFGSAEEFERCVRHQVSMALERGLGRHAFPYTWFLGIMSCVSWGFGDFALGALRAQDAFAFSAILIDVFAVPFVHGSLMLILCLCLGHKLRRRRATMNWFVSLFAGLVMVLCLLVPRILRVILVRALDNALLAGSLWAFVTAVAAVLAHRMWTVM